MGGMGLVPGQRVFFKRSRLHTLNWVLVPGARLDRFLRKHFPLKVSPALAFCTRKLTMSAPRGGFKAGDGNLSRIDGGKPAQSPDAAARSGPHMAIFPSRPLNPSRLNTLVRRQPLLFGAPFVLLMVATSYGLTYFTQTK